MKQLLALLLRHSRRTVVLATLAGVLSGGANAVLLALANSALHRPRPWEQPWLLGAFAGLCLALPVMRAGSSYLLAGLGQRVVLRLRLDLCRGVVGAPLRTVEELGTHRIFAALTEDVAAVSAAVALLPLLFVQGAIVAGCLVYLGWLSLTALAVVSLMLALGIATYQLPTRRAARWQREQRETAERLWGHFGTVTGGIKELKLHAARREALMGQLGETGDSLRRAAVRSTTLFSAAAGWGQMVIFALVGTVVFALPAVHPGISASTVTGYALVLLYLMTPLELILDAVPALSRARVALGKVDALGFSLGAPSVTSAASAHRPDPLPSRVAAGDARADSSGGMRIAPAGSGPAGGPGGALEGGAGASPLPRNGERAVSADGQTVLPPGTAPEVAARGIRIMEPDGRRPVDAAPVLPTGGAPAVPADGTGIDERWGTLELAGVCHSYRREGEDGEFTLGPINLTVRRGELVFLVGGNGSGKTTLAKLLVGLYVPAAGEVRLDGHPVTADSRDAYLQQFSVIFSDFHLFDTLLGLKADGLDEQAARYLDRLRLARKVAVKGGRLSTTALSQGQRKRLALLTAWLEDRPVYLFDEWAADQDPVFKKLFYQELLPELRARGKTVLVISHDDHFYAAADRVIKLNEGRVEYDGSALALHHRAIPGQAQLA